METLLIFALCLLNYPRDSLQDAEIPESGIPYPPSSKGCEVQHTHHEKSVNLCCSKCPPGTFKVRSCSGLQDTICHTCPLDTYTEVWNSISGCISCRGTCKAEHGLIQLQECTRTTRRRCICNHGTYCQPGVEASDTTCSHCVQHSPCGPGQGVTMPGNYSANTVCRACPSGTFSDTTSTTQRCQIHTNCSSLGKSTSRRGNATADSDCDHGMDGTKGRVGQEKIDSTSVSLAVPSTILFLIVITTGFCLIQGFPRRHPLQLACLKKVFKSCTSDPEAQNADYKSPEATCAELLSTTEVPQRQIPPPSITQLHLESETNQERPCECRDATDRSNIHPSDCGNRKEDGTSDAPRFMKPEDGGVKSTGFIGPVYICNPSRVYVGVFSGHRDSGRSLPGRDETATNDGTLHYPQEEQGTCEREMGEFPQQECGKDSHISESVSDNP